MARKTPAKVLILIERHAEYMNHIDELIRVKTTVPEINQADHVKEKTVEYIIGLANGASVMLETVLHTFNCYHGFSYIGPVRTNDTGKPYNPYTRQGNPDFASWRVRYIDR